MYKGLAGKVTQEQRLLNMRASDALLNMDARPAFEEWFESNIEFGFGMGWMKGIAKKFCWYGYFAGYKRGLDNE